MGCPPTVGGVGRMMVNCQTFISILTWLDVDCRKLSTIVSERRPTCWLSGESCYISTAYPKFSCSFALLDCTKGSIANPLAIWG